MLQRVDRFQRRSMHAIACATTRRTTACRRGGSLGEQGQRTVLDLLVEQVGFCDVIVLDKIDMAGHHELAGSWPRPEGERP